MAVGMKAKISRVQPGTTSQMLVDYNERRRALIVQCVHATVGAQVSTVAGFVAGAGQPLAANMATGSKLTIRGLSARWPLYGLANSATTDLSIVEASDADIA